jgi:predicted ATPase
MLTRIEIDGFKTFERFVLDLEPLTVLAGANASGKSNLLETIELLSRLAGTRLPEALQGLRGQPDEIFRTPENGTPSDRITLAVEVLLNPRVSDPWGRQADLSHTRARYEVVLARPHAASGSDRLIVAREAARPILAAEDDWLAQHPVSADFRAAYLREGRTTPWLTTDDQAGSPVFTLHEDGGPSQTLPATNARATVLGDLVDISFPHLFALRQEFLSWRCLHLAPESLRRPSSLLDTGPLRGDGGNLSGVLARLQSAAQFPGDPLGLLADIQSDLAGLLPEVRKVSIEEDPRDREYRLRMQVAGGPLVGARLCSDGSLRLLALLAILHDPEHRGLVCLEEPENGIHPSRLPRLLELARRWMSDPGMDEVVTGEPLGQLLLATHSPVLLEAVRDAELRFADTVRRISPGQPRGRTCTRIRAVRPAQPGVRLSELTPPAMTRGELKRALASVAEES